MADKQAAKEKVLIQLGPTAMQAAEFERTVFRARAIAKTTQADIERLDYWAHQAAKLKAYDKIEVVCEDGSFYAECLVLETARTWARIQVLRFDALGGAEASQPAANPEKALEDFEVSFKGARAKWTVVRKSDRALLKDGLENREAAFGWLRGHLALTAPAEVATA